LIQDLLEFAEHNFKLNKADDNGTKELEHLEQVERQTGIRPEGLEAPPFPNLLSHIWSAFILLHDARTAGFSGPNSLTYESIIAWVRLTGNPLNEKEVKAIKSLDNLYMRMQ
tara:strand:+ start:16159 stop:16494 length:336 start_codon:yes stop_codon:yes gene_type:complete